MLFDQEATALLAKLPARLALVVVGSTSYWHKESPATCSGVGGLADRTSWIGALEFVRTKGYKAAEPGKSYHQNGMAYDISGVDLQKIKGGVLKAVAAGSIRLVDRPKNLILETQNHCVHVEIESATLDHEPFEYA